MSDYRSNNRHKFLLQYHIIFVCKYRKELFLSKCISDDIKSLSKDICDRNNILIKYMETDKDHIHYMIETIPNISISKIVQLIKSYTTYHIWKNNYSLLKKYYWKCFEKNFKRIYRKSGVIFVLKTYKYRIYPNNKQTEQINKTFGCCRFVYNTLLSYRIEQYKNNHISMSKIDCNNYCNRMLKNENLWLKEVDKFALTNSIYNMDNAFNNFFKENCKYPKFKNKHGNYKSYTTNYTNNNIVVDFNNNKIKLPKLNLLKASIHRKFNGIIKNATVSQTPTGKYYVSVLVNTNIDILPAINKKIGIDLGIKDLVITSDGKKYSNIKIFNKLKKELIKYQRGLSKKKKGSNNYNKAKQKLALIHEKIHNTRCDYLHKISHEIISENQVIITENLQIKNMEKNHNLSSSIIDASWNILLNQLKYKSEWYGRKYITVDKFYSSSQICSNCGYKNSNIKDLSIRVWDCPNCNAHHNRDINAAINILHQGLQLV